MRASAKAAGTLISMVIKTTKTETIAELRKKNEIFVQHQKFSVVLKHRDGTPPGVGGCRGTGGGSEVIDM